MSDPGDSGDHDTADPTGPADPADPGRSRESIGAVRAVGAYVPPRRIEAETIADAWGRFEARGIDRTAVPGPDEDALTMARRAGAAALRALSTADGDVAGSGDPGSEPVGRSSPGAAVDVLAVATSTPPVAEEDPTARLGAMLGVPEGATRQTFVGSTRAGTRALWATLDAVRAADRADAGDGTTRSDPDAGDQGGGPSVDDPRGPLGLVAAADCPRGEPDSAVEHAAGAGAAALVVAPEGPARVVDRAEHATPAPGTRFRPAGDRRTRGLDVARYDRSAFVDAVAAAVDGLAAGPADPAPAAAPICAPDGDLPYRAADAAGVDRSAVERSAVVGRVGDVGAASPLLELATALAGGADGSTAAVDAPGSAGDGGGDERGGNGGGACEEGGDDRDRIDDGRLLVLGYGSGGGADALDLRVDGPVPGETAVSPGPTVTYPAYLRLRDEITPPAPAGGGASVSVPSWRRSLPGRYRPVAGRCDCGALTCPPEGACTDCGRLVEFDRVSLPRRGTVETVTQIGRGGEPPEFAPQQARDGEYGVAIVAFEVEGRTASLPLQVVDGDVAVGDPVVRTVRRLYTQEGVTRYGTKVRPAGE